MDLTDGRLDAAVLAYRENPTEENRAALMAVQREHHEAFLAQERAEIQARMTPNGCFICGGPMERDGVAEWCAADCQGP